MSSSIGQCCLWSHALHWTPIVATLRWSCSKASDISQASRTSHPWSLQPAVGAKRRGATRSLARHSG
jgi:hypothetical protein